VKFIKIAVFIINLCKQDYNFTMHKKLHICQQIIDRS